MAKATAELRRKLEGDGPVLFAGVYDALSARIAEQAGFDGLWVSGYAAAASLLGKPDVGLVTQSEMTDLVARICQAATLPVICDGECGYGNAINVIRTVQEFQRAGAAGMQLDDKVQEICPFLDMPIELLSAPEAVLKFRAVGRAKAEEDFFLCANAEHDPTRVRPYIDAGADAVMFRWDYVIGPDADPVWSEAVEVCRNAGAAAVAVQVPFIRQVDYRTLHDAGFNIVIAAVENIFAAARAQVDLWRHYMRVGSADGFEPMIFDQAEFLSLLDEKGVREAIDEFLDPARDIAREAKREN